MKFVLSIVSHGQTNLVNLFLRSLSSNTSYNKYKNDILIVITHNIPEEKVDNKGIVNYKEIWNLRRRGFSANHNRSFEISPSEYFLVINPDILITPDFSFDFIINSIVSNDQIAVFSPLIINENAEQEDYRRADITLVNLIKRKLGLQEKDFDWFAGMFLCFRSSAFYELGGFDERFFMYVEDCDICMRAVKNGLKLATDENVVVEHIARRESRRNIRHMQWHVMSILRYWRYNFFR